RQPERPASCRLQPHTRLVSSPYHGSVIVWLPAIGYRLPAMQLAWGHETLELAVDETNLVAGRRAPIAPDIADPVQAMRDALEHPLDYPALRLALTPDDHVALVVDETIPHLGRLLTPVLEHIRQAHVKPEAITLICPTHDSDQAWLDDLPDEFQDVQVETHQATDRKKLAYLATTKEGRRIYLNRTVVDADQVVVLGRRSYDPVLGCAGAETSLFPMLSDEATLEEYRTKLKSRAPDALPWPVQQEAREVTWMAGAPFFLQVIPGTGDNLCGVLAGPLESSGAGQTLIDARWRCEYERPADVVIASVTGAATGADLARAFFAAARVVKPSGSIVLLSDVTPALGPSFEVFRRHDEPALALRLLMQEKPGDLAVGYMWATAAEQARLYLLSGLSNDIAEELFTIPLQHAEQARRLLGGNASCIVLEDAHKTLAVLA
ncbi:MAG TPA: lactate racemase domain-containing protein, partial [Gemmataceae bacterium]|nr:lactate racemase domain-containing protein [Gemmataceae bacterium]